ncbi:MAG: threonine/serine exporter family protein [Clostridiales bacterium]|nr:threonine/serine exporter family protein [Clostridiales bacterium]
MSEPREKTSTKVIRQHMSVHWHDIVRSDSDIPAVDSELKEKTSLVGRIGIMYLSVGTSAWRVRNAMNRVSRALNISCNANIGLLTLTFTCFSEGSHYSQTISLPNTGVNTDKLMELKLFTADFSEKAKQYSVEQLHQVLDKIEAKKPNYVPWQTALAAAFACGAFTFLLGGGIVEMICAFIGAGAGCFVRTLLIKNKINLLVNVASGVAVACAAYVVAVLLGELIFGIPPTHHAGYICAMLFIIPGFPLITGGIDLAKLDIRSGVERIIYAGMIIMVATMVGWVMATVFRFNPADFPPLDISVPVKILCRALASFVGVYGFSLMFNSTRQMALAAGVIGTIANVVRLELMDVFGLHIAVAAFLGATIAGLLASVLNTRVGVPRISLTVPSIVIMVPGLFMYKAIYYIGLDDISVGGAWLTKALMTVIALPIGLVFARSLTDKDFRHCS